MRDRLRRMWLVPLVCLVTGLLAAGPYAVASGQDSAPDGADASASEELFYELMYEGQLIYSRDCSTCHSTEGGMETIGPPLAGNAAVGSTEYVVTQILQGSPEKGMPPFALTMSDRQIAAAGTFVRNAWDHAFGIVLESDVRQIREQTAVE